MTMRVCSYSVKTGDIKAAIMTKTIENMSMTATPKSFTRKSKSLKSPRLIPSERLRKRGKKNIGRQLALVRKQIKISLTKSCLKSTKTMCLEM